MANMSKLGQVVATRGVANLMGEDKFCAFVQRSFLALSPRRLGRTVRERPKAKRSGTGSGRRPHLCIL